MFEDKNKEKVTRKEIADYAVSNADQHSHFLLDMVMRSGKSFVAIELVKYWNCKSILILSDAIRTNNQWLSNLQEYNPQLLDKVDVYCYHSLHKLDRNKYDCILLDEFELARSNKRIEQIFEFTPVHWIAMSGTLSLEDRNDFRMLTSNNFFTVKIELEDAVKWGIINTPKVICVPLEFDNENSYLVYRKNNDKKKKTEIVDFHQRWNSIKNKSVNTWVKCTEEQYHQMLNEDLAWRKELYDTHQTEVFRLSWLKKGNERKKFFAESKTRWFKRLYSKLPKDSRCLVFCFNTEQADLINAELSIHSKNPDSAGLLEAFNNKEINFLGSVKMINRGIDFNSVDYCIILQQDGSQKASQQQAGRAYLSMIPKIITFYYPNTQDETYLRKFLEPFKDEWIFYKKIED